MLDIEKILFSPVTKIINIKPDTEAALLRLDIKDIKDLVFHKPTNYLYLKLNPEENNIAFGDRIRTDVIIKDIEISKRYKSPTKIYVEGVSGPLVLVFFNKIPPFIFAKLRIEAKITIEGIVEHGDFYKQIKHPDFIFTKAEGDNKIEPLYPLTYGLSNRQLVNYMEKVFARLEISHTSSSALEPVIHNYKMDSRVKHENDEESHENTIISTLKKIHFPKDKDELNNLENNLQILAKYEATC
ncbi:MAG UNVERIFIED_CONTAM: hypothetical protein LVQ98_05015 [Rickettsiaceae bacterium]|jgi:ATP-dependent DNA helicase RecG